MSSLDAIKKELGSLITRRIMAALGAKGPGARVDEAPGSMRNSSAWKEVEHKLQDLFGNDEIDADRMPRWDRLVVIGALALVALLAITYLLGRRGGRRRSTILEIHKA